MKLSLPLLALSSSLLFSCNTPISKAEKTQPKTTQKNYKITLQNRQLTQQLAAITNPSSVTSLNAASTSLKDSHLKSIQAMTSLRELNLFRTQITDDGFNYIKDLKELRKLDISYTMITDEGLKTIADLENLRVLDCAINYVTHDGIAHLEKLKNLQHLSLRGNNIDSRQLVNVLKKFPKLTYLNLSFTHGQIRDEQLAMYAELKGLRFIDLTETKTSKNGIAALKEAIPSLTVKKIQRSKK